MTTLEQIAYLFIGISVGILLVVASWVVWWMTYEWRELPKRLVAGIVVIWLCPVIATGLIAWHALREWFS